MPYKRTKLAGERLALDAAARGADVVIVNPTTPVGPGDRRPTPTGKMVADVASGRARAYLAAQRAQHRRRRGRRARARCRAFERGRAGQRYLLGGENLSMRAGLRGDRCDAVADAAPGCAVPWRARLRRGVGRLRRVVRRSPALLVARRGPRRALADALRRRAGARASSATSAAADALARGAVRGPLPRDRTPRAQRLALAVGLALRPSRPTITR